MISLQEILHIKQDISKQPTKRKKEKESRLNSKDGEKNEDLCQAVCRNVCVYVAKKDIDVLCLCNRESCATTEFEGKIATAEVSDQII
jgi:hypothetical protein